MTDASAVDPEASDLLQLLAIREGTAGFDLEKTVFDFSISIVAPQHANNRIHTEFSHKARVDGFIQNVLRPGRHCREVGEAEYRQFHDLLVAKSEHLQRERRRKRVRTESRPEESPLP